ncbi:hypothetical protein MKX64_21555 [Paenibacillus sp. FSL M8-0334]|uniref:hypothetical protein n=1 Tax=Paenibacillus sp. FSL M8-0334 TaxID=2921623 RepID=UPI0030FB2137
MVRYYGLLGMIIKRLMLICKHMAKREIDYILNMQLIECSQVEKVMEVQLKQVGIMVEVYNRLFTENNKINTNSVVQQNGNLSYNSGTLQV